ncbi:hypothetical protein [Rhodococcus sp. NPDC058521]|uniref:hypothetical protein n=1 Tax=Rhodococcus sp. NPDC058521 TaxID=3346536 RepID=UPI00366550B1
MARFWNHGTTDADLENDFGGSIDGTEPSADLIVRCGGIPIGFVQRYRLKDYPEDTALLG